MIVYDAGGRFGSYGHVGKVLHYDKQRDKIIVRDMARVGLGIMSDRREDLTTANVKCYIYNIKNNISVPSVSVDTGSAVAPVTGTQTISQPTTPSLPVVTPPATVTPIAPSPVTPLPTPSIHPPEEPTHNAPIPVSPGTSAPVVAPIIPTTPPQTSLNKKISLVFENLSDIADHFMTQNTITRTLVAKSPLKL